MRVGDAELYVEELGAGPPVLFSHGLLWSARMFAPQLQALGDRYRCVAYDHRGQGRSEPGALGVMDLETLTQDAIAIIERLELAPCHFVGLSMGGFVGMRIAARRPELLRSLTLLATAGDAEPAANVPRYRAMNALLRLGAARLLTRRVAQIMFGESFLQDTSRRAERDALLEHLRRLPRYTHRAVEGVISRHGVMDELPRIRTPTLIVRGAEDHAIARERAEATQRAIAGSRIEHLLRGGHTLTLEEPGLVNSRLAEFLAAH